jgi:predicted ATPase/DNA-binding SARP family transcriptional activator
MSRRQLFLFGMPRLVEESQRVNIERRRSMALLAYLAVTRQPHSRDLLAALFWPEKDQASARAGLRRELHNLKKTLPDGILDIREEHASMAPGAELWVDVIEFESLLDQVQEHGHNLDPLFPGEICSECLPRLESAASLYKASFMAGFSLSDSAEFDDWQFFQGEKLRLLLAQALQKLAGWHAEKGKLSAAIEDARRWLALDNLHEPAHRILTQLFYASGQQAPALRQYQECLRLLDEQLGVEPEAETTKLYQAIQSRQISLPSFALPTVPVPDQNRHAPSSSQRLHNLPTLLTPILGRQSELARLTKMLVDDPACRLLTLLGPGGSGKTRLALETARLLLELSPNPFKDGVWFINLVPLSDSQAILPAIAQVLSLSLSGDPVQRQEQLLDYLQAKNLLLLLDNMEHLIDPLGQDLINSLLSEAPGVRLLVTSRSRLNLRLEQLLLLDGLRVPPLSTSLPDQELPQLTEYSAVQLFQICASRLLPGFSIDRNNFSAVVKICHLVEGMPLGLEMAASWIELLSPDEIAVEIEHGLDFLETSWDDVPQRQRSLRAVFDSSWNLLGKQERQGIAALSVFLGSFTRQAAISTAGTPLTMLLALVNKSWLQRAQGIPTPNQNPQFERYQIHELSRQYAAEKLQTETQAYQRARDGHFHYYTSFLKQQAQLMRGPRQQQAFQEVELEFENIRAAWIWGVSRGDFSTLVYEILPAMFLYCEARARVEELLNLIELARQAYEKLPQGIPAASLLPVLLTVKAAFYEDLYPVRFESYGLMVPGDVHALRLAWSQSGNQTDLLSNGFWGILLTYLYGRMLDLEAGAEYLRQLAPLFNAQGKLWEQALSLYFLGNLLEVILTKAPANPAIYSETGECLSSALSIFNELGDEREAGNTQRALGNLRNLEGNYWLAVQHWRAAQQQLEAAGEPALAVDIYTQIGDVYLAVGEFQEAFHCYRTVWEFYELSGNKRLAAYRMSKESFELVRYGDLEEAIRLREKAMEILKGLKDGYGEAWNAWEMGEAQRVLGDNQAARSWFEQAYLLFLKVQDTSGYAFSHRGLGDLALAERDFASARTEFLESTRWAEISAHNWLKIYTLSGLARAEIGLVEHEQAEEHLIQAVSIALAAEAYMDPGILLVVLCAMAELYAVSGRVEQAGLLASVIMNHYSAWREIKRRASALLASLPKSVQTNTCDNNLVNPWQLARELLRTEDRKGSEG